MHHNCIRIFIAAEMITPNFNFCDYAIGHDKLDFGDRYFRSPAWLAHTNYENLQQKHVFSEDDLRQKNKFCSFVYSNSGPGTEYRKRLFQYISKNYKKVDSAGRFMHEIDIPEVRRGDLFYNKVEFMKDYKFTIAAENGPHPGYVTEKLSNAFEAKTIPIYFGDETVSDEFNTASFINCHEYGSFKDILRRIIEIDHDDNLFMKMMRTPALLVKPDDIIQRRNEFLYHIIDQPYEKAFRRNKACWGYKLERATMPAGRIVQRKQHRKEFMHEMKGTVKKVLGINK